MTLTVQTVIVVPSPQLPLVAIDPPPMPPKTPQWQPSRHPRVLHQPLPLPVRVPATGGITAATLILDKPPEAPPPEDMMWSPRPRTVAVVPERPQTAHEIASLEIVARFGEAPLPLPPLGETAPSTVPEDQDVLKKPDVLVPTFSMTEYPTPLGILRAPTNNSGWKVLSDALMDLGQPPKPPSPRGPLNRVVSRSFMNQPSRQEMGRRPLPMSQTTETANPNVKKLMLVHPFVRPNTTPMSPLSSMASLPTAPKTPLPPARPTRGAFRMAPPPPRVLPQAWPSFVKESSGGGRL